MLKLDVLVNDEALEAELKKMIDRKLSNLLNSGALQQKVDDLFTTAIEEKLLKLDVEGLLLKVIQRYVNPETIITVAKNQIRLAIKDSPAVKALREDLNNETIKELLKNFV